MGPRCDQAVDVLCKFFPQRCRITFSSSTSAIQSNVSVTDLSGDAIGVASIVFAQKLQWHAHTASSTAGWREGATRLPRVLRDSPDTLSHASWSRRVRWVRHAPMMRQAVMGM
ncbi:hypothetical protein ACFQZO_08175 [Bradyrhizobium sp. GCM10027634]|uniref:hypothetical protein n=1 Tax=unclassified Bradyrhizobium TaxID=2631580 RepID=UPI00188DA73C|nr:MULTISPECIES: hypothetical protein [unclassified Bradyrhizobium]MDN5000855.1 hypothetical protein [Bradyrhizobium sp. WYCCWR 12677]